MKSKFLQVSLGVSMMLLAAGFFIRSVNVANADPKPEFFLQQGTNKIGKYMWFPIVYNDNSCHYLIWDTETGKSKRYALSNGRSSIVGTQLPENPME